MLLPSAHVSPSPTTPSRSPSLLPGLGDTLGPAVSPPTIPFPLINSGQIVLLLSIATRVAGPDRPPCLPLGLTVGMVSGGLRVGVSGWLCRKSLGAAVGSLWVSASGGLGNSAWVPMLFLQWSRGKIT